MIKIHSIITTLQGRTQGGRWVRTTTPIPFFEIYSNVFFFIFTTFVIFSRKIYIEPVYEFFPKATPAPGVGHGGPGRPNVLPCLL